jgi:hypothetical protein
MMAFGRVGMVVLPPLNIGHINEDGPVGWDDGVRERFDKEADCDLEVWQVADGVLDRVGRIDDDAKQVDATGVSAVAERAE